MSKAILFDFFGVICSEIAPFWLEKHFSKERAIKVKKDIVGLVDDGSITEYEMLFRLSTLTNVAPYTILDEWLSLAKIDQDAVKLINDYKDKAYIYLLSNANSQFLNRILDKNNLNKLFKKIFISSEMRISKPDIKFYEFVLDDIKMQARDCIFIDDNITNVESAQSIGFNSIIFNDFAITREKIEKFISEQQ